MDADVWRRSEVLRDLNQYTLSLHEHGERLGLAPLTSRDARVGAVFLGTLFATILRDECRADVCLYNSGGIRGNASYGSEPLTYGDLVAEVPFENNIITLEMTGDEVRDAIAFSEAEQIRKSREGGSWGGYLQWDEGVAVRRRRRGARDDVDSNADANANAGADVGFEWNVETIRGRAFEPGRVYRVVTWAGLLDGADDIPVLRDIGRRIAANLRAESDRDGEEHERGRKPPRRPSAARTVSRSRSSSCVTSLVGDGARSSLGRPSTIWTRTATGNCRRRRWPPRFARGRRRRRRNRKRRRWFARSTPTATAR